MIGEWIRFGVTALFCLLGLGFFALAALGVNSKRFGFVLDRMHCASLGDTLGVLFLLGATVVKMGDLWVFCKLVFAVALLWFTSPVSSHLLARIELETEVEPSDGRHPLPLRKED